MRVIAMLIALTLILPSIVANEKECVVKYQIHTYDGIKEMEKRMSKEEKERIFLLFNQVIRNLNENSIKKILHALENEGFLGSKELKKLEKYFENAFCIIAGYGAICIQFSLRNLPFFLLLIPISLLIPEISGIIWAVLSAGIKFFRIATLAFLILASVACVGIFGEWNFTAWITDIFIIGFVGIWINWLPGFTFIGAAAYVKAPFP